MEKKNQNWTYSNNSAHHSFRMEVLGGGEALILKNKFKVNKFHASLRVETAKPLSTAHEYIKGGGEPLFSLKVFYLVCL